MAESAENPPASPLPPLPPLVIVSGAPGSGKTTLAALLAPALRLPLLGKDAIKESLAASLGTPKTLPQAQAQARDEARALGAASFTLLETLAESFLANGAGLILEANFRRGRAETWLRPLVTRAHGVLIHCETSPETILERYAARAATGERHPIHHDSALITQVAADLAAGLYAPLDLAIATLRVATTDGYVPPLGSIIRFIQDHEHQA